MILHLFFILQRIYWYKYWSHYDHEEDMHMLKHIGPFKQDLVYPRNIPWYIWFVEFIYHHCIVWYFNGYTGSMLVPIDIATQNYWDIQAEALFWHSRHSCPNLVIYSPNNKETECRVAFLVTFHCTGYIVWLHFTLLTCLWIKLATSMLIST